jgi:hypothetical protein
VAGVGLHACKEKRPEVNERDGMWGGGQKGAASDGACKEPGVRLCATIVEDRYSSSDV